MKLRLENGDTVEADALIGADGVHSAIRQSLFGADRPEFTGCMAWRGVIPVERLPPGLIRPVGTNWVGPGRHVIHYYLRRGELLNFVGIVERDDWQVESWSAQGTHAECAADFEGWDETVHVMIRNITTPFKWALMGREPMARWTIGRVSLLGDACHATLPFLAQGAVMAIEDGMVLARCLEAHDDVETALTRYQDMRAERGHGLGARPDVDQGVVLPRLGAGSVGVSAPEVDGEFAVDRDGDGGADFIAGGEVGQEGFADGLEASVAGSVDVGGHGCSPLGCLAAV